MTVEQLILELAKIEDKTKPVYVYDTNSTTYNMKHIVLDVEEMSERIDLNFNGDY